MPLGFTQPARQPGAAPDVRPDGRPDGRPLPAPSPVLFGLFARYVPNYLRRHFHAVRVAKGGMPPEDATAAGPLIVYLTHPAWWDPLVCLLLATRFFPGRRHFAPMESAALGRYGFFRRLGFFGIEPGTRRGAAEFLRVGAALLDDPRAVLWVTAAGRFTDARERPVRLRPGVAHLARRLGRGTVLPLALEYAFWQERTPEALAWFGEPIPLTPPSPARSAAEWNGLLEAKLEQAQDALAAASVARDPAAFDTLLGGQAGVGGAYDLWRRLRACLRGERFQSEHGLTPSADAPPAP